MQSKKLAPINVPEQQRNYPAQQPQNRQYLPQEQYTNQPNYGQGFTGGQYQPGTNQIYPSYPTGVNHIATGNVMNAPVNFANLPPNTYIPKR